jgi:hypothetical protein
MVSIKYKIYKFKSIWRLNYQDPVTQKRIRKSFNLRREAETYINELGNLHRVSKDANKTISEFYEIYLQEFPYNASADKAKRFVNLFLNYFGESYPYEVTTTDLASFFTELRDVHGMTNKSISNYKLYLSFYWSYLYKHGFILEDIWKSFKIKSESNHKLFTKPQVDLIMKHLFITSEYLLYPIFRVMKELKLNLREALALKWENIENNKANIVHEGRLIRSVDIPEETAIYLKFIKRHDVYVLTNRYGTDKATKSSVDRALWVHREKFKEVNFDVKLFVQSVRKHN